MKVLYIDGVGQTGGASRSFVELVQPLRDELGVEPYLWMVRGSVEEYYNAVSLQRVVTRGMTRIDNTKASAYRGIRWFILLREIFYLPGTLWSLLRVRLKWDSFDIVHANEITWIIPALLAKLVYRCPLVIHVRSVQSPNRSTMFSRFVGWANRRFADAVIAIDENVRSSVSHLDNVCVIHNSFSKELLEPRSQHLLKLLDAAPGEATLRVGFVGNLHVAKGILDLAEAAAIVKENGKNIVFLILGGYTRHDKGFKSWILRQAGIAQNVSDRIEEDISRLGIEGTFLLLGPHRDIQTFYERIDVICFPSHFDAPGRPVFEAAVNGVPCIACVSNPFPDTLVPGVTGLVVPEKNPVELARAISWLHDNRDELSRLGIGAQKLGTLNFDASTNARDCYSLYRRIGGRGYSRFPS